MKFVFGFMAGVVSTLGGLYVLGSYNQKKNNLREESKKVFNGEESKVEVSTENGTDQCM